ncbi:MAG: FAD-dependent oxidoreductase, partial [Myxococcota bacterium]
LAAVWTLSARGHRVTVYEAQPRLGMDAHAVDVAGARGEVRIDVPMRVFFPEYYPKLVGLYDDAGVGFETLDYSGSFGSLGGELYFKYRTYPLAGAAWPFLDRRAINADVVRLGVEVVSFLSRLRLQPPSPESLDGVTFEAFLDGFGCSDRLRWRFLMPLFAAICTCSYASLAMYPARTIVGYLASVMSAVRMRRVTLGVRHVVETLSSGAEAIRLASPVRSLRRTPSGVEVEDHRGHSDRFDHVVLATQANQALSILGHRAAAEERAALTAFGYESFEVVTHTDRRLAPAREQWWSPVNFLLGRESRAPMATILMNPIHRGLGDAEPVLQTWNPLLEPAPERVYSR